MATIQFLGATQTVTGSKHLLEVEGFKVLVDCGLFQGLKELRQRNWAPFPIDPASIDAVVLTHAHIDHTGYLPRLVRNGFRGPVYATPASVNLARILLPDSAKLQEEEAAYANKKGYSKHKPALPLYTARDAEETLTLLHSVNYRKRVELTNALSFEFVPAGHILGSGFVSFEFKATDQTTKRLIVTGDIGRYDEPIINDPASIAEGDYLVLESTYGDRAHPETNVKEDLAQIINRTIERGGHIVIPAFAVGRTQQLVYLLRELEDEQRIPIVPVYVDSPMAIKATRLYLNHKEDHDLDMKALVGKRRNPLSTNKFKLAKSVGQSKNITAQTEPAITITANGMGTGGRVLHHLYHRLPDDRSTIIFVGFQAAGTRGRLLVDGATEVKIFGEQVPVQAEIAQLSNLSAHGDYNEILRWLTGFQQPLTTVFLVHGEPAAAAALKVKIEERFNWSVEIPEYAQKFQL